MRKLPTLLAAIFLFVQINRVAAFSSSLGANIIFAWLFSIGLALGVFVAAYWTRESITVKEGKQEDRRAANTRKSAGIWLIVFVVADGLFNLADVIQHIPDGANNFIHLAAWIYGAFPTLASAGLGKLQGQIDRLPIPPNHKHGLSDVFSELMREFIGDKSAVTAVTATLPAAPVAAPATLPAVTAIAAANLAAAPATLTISPAKGLPAFRCDVAGCDWHSDGQRERKNQQLQFAGHMRSHQRGQVKQ